LAGLLKVEAGLLNMNVGLLSVDAGLLNVKAGLLKVEVQVGLLDVTILDLIVGAPRPAGVVVGTSTGNTARDDDEAIMVALVTGIALPGRLCAEKCAMHASSVWHQSEGP
jgi:hypothetical protein